MSNEKVVAKNASKLREFLALDHRSMGRAVGGGDGSENVTGLHILTWYGLEKRGLQIERPLLRQALLALCSRLEVASPEEEAEKLLGVLYGTAKLHWKAPPAWREGKSPVRRAGRPAGSRNKVTLELEALKAQQAAQQPATPAVASVSPALAQVAGEVAFEVATGKIAMTASLKNLLSMVLEGANKKAFSLVFSLAVSTLACGAAQAV